MLLQYISYRDSLVASMPQLLDLANQGPAPPFGIPPTTQAANEARLADHATVQALRLLCRVLVQACKLDICFFRNSIVSDISFFKRFYNRQQIKPDDPLNQLVNNKTITITIAVPAPTLSMISKGLAGGTSTEGGVTDPDAECQADCDCACTTGDCGCGCDPTCPCHRVERPAWLFEGLRNYRAPKETVGARAAALLSLVKFLLAKSEMAGEQASMRRETIASAAVILNAFYFDYETQFEGCDPAAALGAFSANLSIDFQALVSALGASSTEYSMVKNCLGDSARRAAPSRPAQAALIIG